MNSRGWASPLRFARGLRFLLVGIGVLAMVPVVGSSASSYQTAVAPPVAVVQPVLTTLSPRDQLTIGLRLEAPDRAPVISKTEAEQVLRRFTGGAIRESVLALASDCCRSPQLAWVFSMEPGYWYPHGGPIRTEADGPRQPTIQKGRWFVVWINATTGEFVRASRG